MQFFGIRGVSVAVCGAKLQHAAFAQHTILWTSAAAMSFPAPVDRSGAWRASETQPEPQEHDDGYNYYGTNLIMMILLLATCSRNNIMIEASGVELLRSQSSDSSATGPQISAQRGSIHHIIMFEGRPALSCAPIL